MLDVELTLLMIDLAGVSHLVKGRGISASWPVALKGGQPGSDLSNL
jgi:hypothetical protein